MAKGNKRGGSQRRSAALSLEKFAGAKKSKYDKKARAEKKAAINAKRINKYRKLKKKILGDGQAAPSATSDKKRQAEAEVEDSDVKRAQSRAGPPPDDEEIAGPDSAGEASPEEELLASKKTSDLKRRPNAQPMPDISAHEAGPAAGGRPNGNDILKGKKQKRKGQKPPSQLQRLAEKVNAEKEVKQKEAAQKVREAEEKQKRIEKSEKKRKKQRELYLKKTKHGQPVMKHRIETMLSKLHAET